MSHFPNIEKIYNDIATDANNHGCTFVEAIRSERFVIDSELKQALINLYQRHNTDIDPPSIEELELIMKISELGSMILNRNDNVLIDLFKGGKGLVQKKLREHLSEGNFINVTGFSREQCLHSIENFSDSGSRAQLMGYLRQSLETLERSEDDLTKKGILNLIDILTVVEADYKLGSQSSRNGLFSRLSGNMIDVDHSHDPDAPSCNIS
ncbi:MAG: hypothetical protein CL816_08590 [Coxiellaceae bacterium]|mgnify:CR=1 FL=1|nr:hypothetical protein [Coxiellaceae bacterium]